MKQKYLVFIPYADCGYGAVSTGTHVVLAENIEDALNNSYPEAFQHPSHPKLKKLQPLLKQLEQEYEKKSYEFRGHTSGDGTYFNLNANEKQLCELKKDHEIKRKMLIKGHGADGDNLAHKNSAKALPLEMNDWDAEKIAEHYGSIFNAIGTNWFYWLEMSSQKKDATQYLEAEDAKYIPEIMTRVGKEDRKDLCNAILHILSLDMKNITILKYIPKTLVA